MELLFYLSLFALGALDAMQPGHAKSLVSSCLVGSNARFPQLVILGLVVTLTHVVINGALAYGIVTFAAAIFNQAYIRYIDIIAATAILILAFYLIWQRFFIKSHLTGSCHHNHPESIPGQAMPVWQIVFLGIASGLTPCPVVLTALISAIGMGRGLEAILGITVFSFGMGLVIFLVGLCTLLGIEKLRWFHQPENVLRLSRISALAVLLLGSALFTRAVFFYEDEKEPPMSLIMMSQVDEKR